MVEIGSGSAYSQVVFRPSGDKLAIVQSGVLSKGTVPLPGGGSAIYNASGLSFIRHNDWLGSSRMATTWNHAVYAKEAYAPFGEPYNEAGTADRSFTGQDQDTTQGIYDYLYRRYDPSAGRWMSPDPSGWSAVNLSAPQSLNRYAYVQNNPMRWTDPTGLNGCDHGEPCNPPPTPLCNGTVYATVCFIWNLGGSQGGGTGSPIAGNSSTAQPSGGGGAQSKKGCPSGVMQKVYAAALTTASPAFGAAAAYAQNTNITTIVGLSASGTLGVPVLEGGSEGRPQGRQQLHSTAMEMLQ